MNSSQTENSKSEGQPTPHGNEASGTVAESQSSPKNGPPAAKVDLSFASLLRFSSKKTKIVASIGLICCLGNGAILPIFINTIGGAALTITDVGDAMYLIELMGILAAVSFVINFIGTTCMETASNNQCMVLRKQFLSSCLRQEIEWYYTIDPGTLTTRLEEDIVLIREALGIKLGNLAMFSFSFVFAIAFALSRNPHVAGVMLSGYPVMAIAMGFGSRAMMRSVRMSQTEYEKAGSVAEEGVALVRMIRAYSTEHKFIFNFSHLVTLAEKAVVKAMALFSCAFGVIMSTLFLLYSLGFYYSGIFLADQLESDPNYNKQSILGVIMIMTVGSFMLGQIAPNIMAVSKGVQAAKDLFEIVDRKSKLDPFQEGGVADVPIQGSIDFQNVSFSYVGTKKNIFEDLSFSIKAGETVAVVGPSGVGKSTIANLIQRFFDPSEGEIKIDGRSLKDYNLQYLRSNIAIISQQPSLFSLSLYENISFGNISNASRESVRKSAKLAYAHDFIKEFPDQYETLVGTGGSQLSGGQKQRVAIARAMLRDPPIFILDEATAALDVESERYVHKAFDYLLGEKKRTTIIVAHRLSTVKNADKIMVFGKVNGVGKIIEYGNHESLMSNHDGHYYKMMNTQTTDDYFDFENETSNVGQELKRATTKQLRAALTDQSFTEKLNMPGFKIEPKTFWGRIKALVFPNNQTNADLTKLKRLLVKLILNNYVLSFFGFLGSIGMGCMFPALAILIVEFVTALNQSDVNVMRNDINFTAAMALVAAGGIIIVVFAQQFGMNFLGQRIVSNLRKMIFSHIMYQPIVFFDDPQNSVGHISSMLSSDVSLVHAGYIGNTGVLLQSMATLVVSFAYSFYVSPAFAGIMIGPFLIIIPAISIRGKKMSPRKIKNMDSLNNHESSAFLMQECLTQISSVLSYGLQPVMLDRFETLVEDEEGGGLKDAIIYGLTVAIAQGGAFGLNAFAFWLGFSALEWGWISDQLAMLRAILMLMYATRGLIQSSMFSADKKRALEASQRITDVLYNKCYTSVLEKRGMLINHDNFKGQLKFTNLKFTYATRKLPIYENVTFDVNPGQTVALVGESGCGKSSVVYLLEKFYEYDVDTTETSTDSSRSNNDDSNLVNNKSSILVDDIPLSELDAIFFRSLIGYVSQDPWLFNATVKENILMGKLDATMDEVISAAKIANAHDFIMALPQQYETNVGKLGGKLSGGQKQRVAIARAVVRQPKLVLLDEATSALDAESEKVVQDALDDLVSTGLHTTLVIAHRLSTIRNADKIVAFKRDPEGLLGSSVVEQGSHEELMQLENGVYKRMLEVAGQ